MSANHIHTKVLSYLGMIVGTLQICASLVCSAARRIKIALLKRPCMPDTSDSHGAALQYAQSIWTQLFMRCKFLQYMRYEGLLVLSFLVPACSTVLM